jgi:hypothetical protein
MLKKNLAIILLLFLSSCGYVATHSINNIANYDFSISKLTLNGERDINIKIKSKLNAYSNLEKSKSFQVDISTTADKTTTAKNASGDGTSFKITITIIADVMTENGSNRSFEITEKFTYNTISNQFDLKRYEREIKINLAEAATDKLIFKLSNL